MSETSSQGATLRDYQRHDIEKIDAALNADIKVLYVLPTGGGKTVVAASIIERAAEAGQRVLVITHRREILKQTSLKLLVEHGLIQAGLNVDLEYKVQVASVQTLHARCMRTDKLTLPIADVIIVDEAHHVAAKTWQKIIAEYPNSHLIGLTATPCRSDGRGLGNFFDQIIEGPQIPELIKQGHLVSTVYYAPVNSQPNLKGIKTVAGDYAKHQLAARMNRDDLVGDIISTWHKYGERRKTLVFCVDVAHSVHVKDEFIRSGVKAEHVDGSTPKLERDAIIARLLSGETEVVCNCMVFTEGFDPPAVGTIVLARPTKQLGLFRQMAGRGLRPAPDKPNLILIDHSGAVYRHGLLEDPVRWTLDVATKADNPTHAARDQQAISRLVECSQCGALRKGGLACDACGFLPKPRPDAIIFADGELARVKNGKAILKTDPAERARWLAMLVGIAEERQYKPGWAAHKYKKKFGHWPPRGTAAVTSIDPSPEVRSWVRSQDIAWAKAQQKSEEARP